MFKVGDRVKCIKPKSNHGSKYDLEANRIYTICRESKTVAYLLGIPGSFIISRFIKVEDYDPISHKVKQMEERFKNRPNTLQPKVDSVDLFSDW